MFDNVLYQSACGLLSDDLRKNRLPGSILFSGPASSGKLSCALELARVVSCTAEGVKGEWNCTCQSCMMHKALVSQNVLLMGPGSRLLEISAAKDTFLSQNAQNSRHLEAARYLYLRAVRKLTSRFTPVLWEGENRSIQKFAPLLQSIDENLQVISPDRVVPNQDELETLLEEIQKDCEKLEKTSLYASLPISQIRNMSSWARLTSVSEKKVVIIENAERMSDVTRNALLKILEEPPKDTIFILTTTKRGAILPTILSRVRTYNFFERSKEHQQEVMTRVFRYTSGFGQGAMPVSIEKFMQRYLPVQPDLIFHFAAKYFQTIVEGHVPDVPATCSACGDFSPKVLFEVFLEGIIEAQKPLMNSASGSECSIRVLEEIRNTHNNVFLLNQNPAAALEELARNLMQVNYKSSGAMRKALFSE